MIASGALKITSPCWRLWCAAALLVVTGGCSSSRASMARHPRPPATPLAKAVIRSAKSYLAESDRRRPQPKDCSDFVDKVFSENGVTLPRSSVEMSLAGARVKSSRELSMGDLVFFSGSSRSRIVGHVGIYVGNGIFIHFSNSDTGVTEESLYSDYYRKRYLTARRVLPRK